MHTTRVPVSPCPNCNAPNHNASRGDDRRPRPGDIGICFNCGAILVFNKELIQHECTEEEWNSFPPETQQEISFIVNKWREGKFPKNRKYERRTTTDGAQPSPNDG